VLGLTLLWARPEPAIPNYRVKNWCEPHNYRVRNWGEPHISGVDKTWLNEGVVAKTKEGAFCLERLCRVKKQ